VRKRTVIREPADKDRGNQDECHGHAERLQAWTQYDERTGETDGDSSPAASAHHLAQEYDGEDGGEEWGREVESRSFREWHHRDGQEPGHHGDHVKEGPEEKDAPVGARESSAACPEKPGQHEDDHEHSAKESHLEGVQLQRDVTNEAAHPGPASAGQRHPEGAAHDR
jgi:hypothetical protein